MAIRVAHDVVAAAPPPSGERSDADLVASLCAGDEAAMGALFDRHADRVRRILLSTLGPDEEIADLVHDVFVRLSEQVEEVRNPQAVASWLVGTAVHRARSLIRRRRRRGVVMRLFASTTVTAQAASPAISAALGAAYKVLDALPADERIAFALRYVHQMTLAEIAEACGTSSSTASVRVRKARARFLRDARREPLLRDFLGDDPR